jgi:putative endonuclease
MPPSPSRPRKSKPSKARIAAYRGGHRGETLAAWFLRLKFYRILSRRYKTPVGEIDLIAQRGGVVVFVEVKARADAGDAAEALEAVNQLRIARAAAYWQSRHPHMADRDCRFDVIFLAPGHWPRHVINAFDAN